VRVAMYLARELVQL